LSQTSAPASTPTEVPHRLDDGPAPKLLGLGDQVSLWANLGISLLVLVSAAFVLAPDPALPPLAPAAALTAVLVGSLIGNALLGLAAVPGAETGAPSMVLLRGLLGVRGSWVPTIANIVQLVGWTTFEIVIIAQSAASLVGEAWRPVFVVVGGALAIVMTIRPLGVVRGYLKKVAVWAVLVSTAYLFFQVLRRPLPALATGSWAAFGKSADIVIALAVSWVPLAADYSRHSRSSRAAFGGAFLGYTLGAGSFFALGVLAFLAFTPPGGGEVDIIASMLAIPAGALALLILVVDELDEAFADLYSTVVSVQNIRPSLDRRWLAIGLGVLCTVLALTLDIVAYENFLLLIGSVFAPLFGVFAVDYYLLRRGRWDVSATARPRWSMLVPWAAGFAAYQLVNPGLVGPWARFWSARQADLGFVPPGWASASVISVAVAAVLALVIGWAGRRDASSQTRGGDRRP
jgi:putative hydroxymethylpyrimidine transporter CytX